MATADKYLKEAESNDWNFFVEHAFCFFDNGEEILSDSRMFYAPIPPYSRIATLGMFVKWWKTCRTDITKDRDGIDALTFSIAGNPLTGTNYCRCVYRDGRIAKISHRDFLSVWSDWRKICKEDEMERLSCDKYYSLRDVYGILKASEESETEMLRAKLSAIENINDSLKEKIRCLEKENGKKAERLTEACFMLYKNELDTFANEYSKRRLEIKNVKEFIEQEKEKHKALLKERPSSHKIYQRIICPITQEYRRMQDDLKEYIDTQMKELTKEGYLTEAMIEKYINSKL